MNRERRGSRDSLGSSLSVGPDGSSGPPRSFRGRGRGDWDSGRSRGDWSAGRGRGRMSYFDDRDTFRRRSRSRDSWRDRGIDRDRERDRDRDRFVGRDRDRDWGRDWERDRDRERVRDRERDWDYGRDRDRDRDFVRRDRFDRRDDGDLRSEHDDRERTSDTWRASKSDFRGSWGAAPAPSPSSTTSFNKPYDKFSSEPTPKPPTSSRPDSVDSSRDSAQPEIGGRSPPKASPPPAPQVPPFGSVNIPVHPTPEKANQGDVSTGPSRGTDDKEPSERPSPTTTTAPKVDREKPPDLPRPSSEHGPQRRDSDTISKPESVSTIRDSKPINPGSQAPGASPTSAHAGKEKTSPTEPSPTSKQFPPPSFPGQMRGVPPAPRASSTSPRMSFSSIPTGPRAFNQRPPRPHKVSNQWVRPGYNRPPSLPGSGPPAGEAVETKARSMSMSEEPGQRTRSPELQKQNVPVNGETMKEKSETPIEAPEEPFKPVEAESKDKEKMAIDSIPEAQKPADNEDHAKTPDFTRSSDEEEDEPVFFTPDYLEERKQDFEKGLQSLRAEMPPPPLEDPNITSLLMRIQLLGTVAADQSVPDTRAEQPAVSSDIPGPDKVQSAEVSEKGEEVVRERSQSPGQKLEYAPPNYAPPQPISVSPITVESLPFLKSGPPTPISDLDVYGENQLNFDRFKNVFRDELSTRRKAIAKKNEGLREEYLSYYKPWRLDVWELDREKGKVPTAPGPATPPGSNSTPTPIPLADGRRYKGNSELDFQLALKASEISAQEELERRRENMATAYPDPAREANIPDMLEMEEKKASVHKNFNNSVDPSRAMDVFGFIPPPDDFTPEEHAKFTDAFMAYPKKWWKIAEALPGRDFHQCIMHYYMTKEEIKYKAKLNKRWSRRGRSKRSARPKSDALMVNLGINKQTSDADDEPLAVTDTGRPRRAAAPTFSSMDAEHASGGRRGNGFKDADGVEKPAGRRTRNAPGTRGRRKVPQQQQAPLSPKQGVRSPEQKPSSRNTVAVPKTEVENTASTLSRAKETLDKVESQEGIPTQSRPRPGRARGGRENTYVLESTEAESKSVPAGRQPLEPGYGGLQTSSYWSVPEQRDFKTLLAHYGRDFEGISNFMKTKTAVMVSQRLDSCEVVLEADVNWYR